MKRAIAAVAVAVLPLQTATARPVSYEGGWTVMEQTDRQATMGLVHYTVSPYLSIGYRADWDRREDMLFNGGQATWLAKRWFGQNYQANLYFYGGLGAATGVGANPAGTGLAALGGVMADWETRRLFVSYRAQVFDADGFDSMVFQAARVGVAPYVGDTGDLHTWLMVEVDHRPDNAEELGVTPLIRLFKGSAMFEAGWSLTDEQPLANFNYRF